MTIHKGFVALLDILGFQRLVSRPGFDDLSAQYLASVATSVGGSAHPIVYHQASDSTILTTADEDFDSLRSLITAVAEISFNALVTLGLPVRGGIASGTYATRDAGHAGTLITGPAVVDAYRTEQQQDWVGVMFSSSLFHSLPDLAELLTAPERPASQMDARGLHARMHRLLLATRYWGIPLHSTNPLSDPTLDGFVVFPKRLDTETPEQLAVDLKSFHEALTRLKLFAPDEAAQRKYRNSVLFFSDQSERWRRFCTSGAWQQRGAS